MLQSKTVVKVTRYSEGEAVEVSFFMVDSFTEYKKELQRRNDSTMIDEYFRAERMVTVKIDEDDEEAMEQMLTLAGLQMDRYLNM